MARDQGPPGHKVTPANVGPPSHGVPHIQVNNYPPGAAAFGTGGAVRQGRATGGKATCGPRKNEASGGEGDGTDANGGDAMVIPTKSCCFM
jgi:hypothetical protein